MPVTNCRPEPPCVVTDIPKRGCEGVRNLRSTTQQSIYLDKDFPIIRIILYVQVFAERSNKYDSHPSLVVIY